jgi:ketosteroid isomerase-like protein
MKRSATTYATAAEVESAFYAAFSRCDITAMHALWARDDAVCVHPGAEAIKGYDAILRSWEHIFRDAELPNVQTHVIQTLRSGDLEVRMVEEHIGSTADPRQGAVVFATNIYRRGDQGWLMVAHNASIMRVQQARSHTLQ